jgi:hypothetical protein
MSEAQPLSKMTKGELADKYGALRQRHKNSGDDIDELKAEFERRGLEAFHGEKFAVVKTQKTFNALDIRRIRAEQPKAWIEARETPQTRTSYEVNRLGADKKSKAKAA